MVLTASSAEAEYVLVLEAAGYLFRTGEPEQHECRLLKEPDTDNNLCESRMAFRS